MDYIIAYTEKNGKGLDENHPWLHEIPFPDDLDSAKEGVKWLSELGFENVTLFGVPSDFYMEMIPWDYINEHKIELEDD